ncbi:immunoglobulin-like domain-containing protein [Listeria booriae]|uniref:Gram-positive cocci surface proteins LPxTG domain-containing protein n=1 Tax=Listeria booriae TaxID=1552123 RepID=A0A842A3U0_9LIST|nr:immunoglobulin-like domain-containing protein [Listeria booriae]MBC1566862.1 hypothetical protein [Listeria booriae]
MTNKKRANKLAKITVASAIAFSALAQPLGNVITVKASEAPVTTKAETTLLTSAPNVQFKNARFESTDTSIPDWRPVSLTIWRGVSPAVYDFSDVQVDNFGTKSYFWFYTGTVTTRGGVSPDSALGRVTLKSRQAAFSTGIQQIIDTVPGEKYTVNFTTQHDILASVVDTWIRVIKSDEDGAKNSVSLIAETYPGTSPTSNSNTFTATKTKTAVSFVVSAGRFGTSGGTSDNIYVSNVSVAKSSTVSIATPTINTITDKDTVVTGTGTANKHVRIELADGTFLTGEVGADGKYSVVLPQQSVGKVVKATLYDGEGNISQDASTTVISDIVAPPTIKPVTSDDTTVRGTGVNGATVTVTIGSQTYTGAVSGGEYSITIPKQSAGTVISATESLNGKTSTSVNTTVTQGTVAAPTINGVKSNDTTVKGTGISGATVTVTIAGQDRTATVGQDGNYSVTIPAQAVGTVITAKQTLNNKTSDSVSTTVTQGTVADPTINPVTTDSTSVKGTGINGATVTITIGSNTYTGTVSGGEYTITIPKQAVGTIITAKQSLNNQTSGSVNTTVTQGTVAAPTINGVKSDDTTVKGTGIAGATVTVTIAGQERTATVGQDGNYSVIIPAQAVGTVITAKQTLNGKTSDPVSTTVTQGTIADPTINPVTTDSTSVKGTGINGATVTITIGSNTYTGTVSGGEYTITIPKQAAGTVITAKQSLNSQTSNSVNTTVTQGELAAPVINTVTSDDTTVTGTGMKGAVVTLTINNQDYTGLVDDNGAYSITIDKQSAGTIITAKQEINAKTSTNATTTVTQGTVTPPVVNPVTTDDTIVTGTGMKGATVKLAIGGIDYTGLVNENGTYAIAILKQPVGTIITATETLGGTTSAATIATVTQGTVAAPTINSLTTADIIVRGTGITGAVVTITIGSNTYTGTVTAGEYAITIPNQPVGTVVSAKQTLNNKTSGSVNTTVTQGAIAAPTINGVTTDSTTVTGTGLAGATVTVTIGSTPYTGTVAANGSYSITIPKQAFGTAITVKQTLNNKTSANASTTVTQGTVAAPTVGAVTTDDTTVKGTGLAGATVTVTIGSTPYTGTVAANGSYSITIPKQAFGTAITVKQTLNNKTSANASTTVTQGTVAAPTVGAVTTDDTTVKGTGLAGATVTVTIGSTPYTGTVAANGSYSITIPKQAFGTAITVKQTLNNKTSANASTTVTQGAIAVPTVGTVTTDDTTVKGTGLAGATVTVTIGSTPYTGTVAANGSYSITIPKQAAGTVISAQQTLNNKTSAAATTTVISTQTTLTADSFTIGVDNYIKGTYTGSSVAKLAIEVNGTVQQKITATGSPYQYYAKGKVTAATDQVYVISYNANGDQLKRVKVDVKSPTAGTLTPDTYYLGSDNYVTGILSGDIVKFSLTVNGVETSKINVTTAPTFRYYANNLIRSLTDIVTVNGYDNTGKLLDSKPVTVGQDRGNPGTIATVAPFKLGKDSYVTGTYTGDIVKVELQVNNTAQQRINVAADGTIKYYAKGKINTTTDVVKLIGYNSAGIAVSTKVVTVSNSDGSITANPYVIGTDSYVKGTYTGDVAKISLTVNGDKKTTITVPTPGPNYQYYAKSLITNASDVVVMTAYDATGGVLDTKTVAVSKPTVVTTGKVTPSAYKIGINTYVDGTYTGDVAKVALEVNGVLSASIPATGNTIHYYAGSLITNKTDVVNVIVYDATGKQLDKKPVEITAPEGTVAPNILKTTDGYLTGSATGDVAKVTLSVNGVKQASISLVQADGTYRYYVKPLALTTSDEVKVIGLDSRGNEITTADVTITN